MTDSRHADDHRDAEFHWRMAGTDFRRGVQNLDCAAQHTRLAAQHKLAPLRRELHEWVEEEERRGTGMGRVARMAQVAEGEAEQLLRSGGRQVQVLKSQLEDCQRPMLREATQTPSVQVFRMSPSRNGHATLSRVGAVDDPCTRHLTFNCVRCPRPSGLGAWRSGRDDEDKRWKVDLGKTGTVAAIAAADAALVGAGYLWGQHELRKKAEELKEVGLTPRQKALYRRQ